jgi:hypothetical protein
MVRVSWTNTEGKTAAVLLEFGKEMTLPALAMAPKSDAGYEPLQAESQYGQKNLASGI